MKIPIEISARHIHLSQKDLDKLFGVGYKLKKLRDLSQTGEFAAEEKVKTSPNPSLVRRGIEMEFRIVGPVRKESQIEISKSEAQKIGINPPIKLSGDLDDVATKLEVSGPNGKTEIKIIQAQRHLHCSPKDAEELNIKNNDKIKIKVDNQQGRIFDKVVVRIGENYKLACHIDIDEANESGLGRVCGFGEIVK
jgi:putative phosphotransacetylase